MRKQYTLLLNYPGKTLLMAVEITPYKCQQPYFKTKSSCYWTTGCFNQFIFHLVS